MIYVLTDHAGNVSECGFSVFVEDEEAPVFDCPADIVYQLGPGQCEVLLPEPVSSGQPEFPEKYASTGMPLFLDELLEAGAVKEKLTAVVAGGALVGPIQQQDLDLDIGGRTVEVIRKFLDAQGISVTSTETGGFFTCCLSLNMQDWIYAIEPAGHERYMEPETFDPPSAKDIALTLEQIRPIPQVALKILRMMDDDDYDINAIAKEVRKDQVISARTLKLCNSALYSPGKRIASLEEALIFIGKNLFIRLVVSSAVREFYNQVGLGYSLCKGGLFQHSVGTAMIAETLARETQAVDSGSAYTAGLLHDIGKVVLDQYLASAYPHFYRQMHDDEQNILSLENKFFGTDHTQVGNELAERWAFPDNLKEAIRHHHYPQEGQSHEALTCIIYLADLLMSRFQPGLELERLNTHNLAARLETIGLSIERFHEIVDLIPRQVLTSSDPDMDSMV